MFRRHQPGDVTSISIKFVLLCCEASRQSRNDSVFTPIAALLQAVLQASTEPFRNGLVETRNRTIKTSRNQSTGSKWSKMMMDYSFWAWNMNSCTVLSNQTNYFCYFPILEYFLFFVYIYIYCVGAGISTWMSISDGLGSYFFHRKMAKTQPTKEEMNGKVFISRQSRHFLSLVNMIQVFFPICASTWRVNNYVYGQGKGIKGEIRVLLII